MFERFDEVQVPDQWDEITNRAAGPGGPANPRPRRSRAPTTSGPSSAQWA